MTNPPPCVTQMQAPLLSLSPFPEDSFTLSDAFEGVAIFGRSGSGKTSGSGQALAKSYLRNGFGGVVLCAKPDEADTWERYAAETGRSHHVIRFDGSGRWRFNFLEYEMQRDNVPRDVLTSNLVDTLMNVVEVADRAKGLAASGGGSDPYWEKAARNMLLMAVDLIYAFTGQVRLSDVRRLLISAPKSVEELSSESWQQESYFAQLFTRFYKTGGAFPMPEAEAHFHEDFWQNSFPNMPHKTRGNVLSTLETDVSTLLRGTMREIFTTSTNVVPELTHDGAIILLDFPLKTWNQTGVLAQLIFKYVWMKATERRTITPQTRPVFLWGDEAQLFTSSYDMEFQSTARSSRASTVLLTQNLPSFYSRIGGDQPEHTVNAMMGNLRTKIFHNNDCTTTNQWATELIGKETVWRQSFGQNSGWSKDQSQGWSDGETTTRNEGISSGASKGYSYSSDSENRGSSSITYGSSVGDNSGTSTSTQRGTSGNVSQGMSGGRNYGLQEERDYAVEPHEFSTQLMSGGPSNKQIVTGVVVLPGRYFERNHKHWMMVAFDQRG